MIIMIAAAAHWMAHSVRPGWPPRPRPRVTAAEPDSEFQVTQ
jgi:hypothetical protein